MTLGHFFNGAFGAFSCFWVGFLRPFNGCLINIRRTIFCIFQFRPILAAMSGFERSALDKVLYCTLFNLRWQQLYRHHTFFWDNDNVIVYHIIMFGLIRDLIPFGWYNERLPKCLQNFHLEVFKFRSWPTHL